MFSGLLTYMIVQLSIDSLVAIGGIGYISMVCYMYVVCMRYYILYLTLFEHSNIYIMTISQ